MGSMRSGLLAGFISSTIWMFISTAVELDKSAVLIGGVACLVGTTLISSAISTRVARSKTS